jgi:hypothetical protein
MKKILLLLSTIILFAACSKTVDPVKDLPAGDGKWILNETYIATLDGVVDENTTATGFLTFGTNGQAKFELSTEPAYFIPYAVNATAVTFSPNTTDADVYNITEKSSKAMTLVFDQTQTLSNGKIERVIATLKLTK